MPPPKTPSVVVRGLETEAGASSIARDRPQQAPWSRILLGALICGPSLWLGGVPAPVVVVFLLMVTLLWIRLCARAEGPLRVPFGAFVGAFAATLTLLQWLPLPLGLRELLAPALTAKVGGALVASGAEPWSGISPVPGDTALEAARLLGLTGLFIAAAQLSWRISAAFVALAGSLVALIGLTQAALGLEAIFGVYQPLHVDPARTPALLTSFVNPNHQAGLFLLGIFAAAALAVQLRHQAAAATDAVQVARLRERGLVALAALSVQGAALLLSLSRAAILALLAVAPLGMFLAWSRAKGEREESRARLWLQRVALTLGMGLLALVVARQGALPELATLSQAAEAGLEGKFRVAADAVDLLGLSPAIGVGRGGFRDLFPAVDSRPVGVLHTHLESAPVAMLVEWGVVPGSLIVLGLLWWWIAAFYTAGGSRHTRARRVALCGPLALAIHNLADFSLEFLGVAAPLCALAGSLSERKGYVKISGRRAVLLGSGALTGAIALATWALPHTWQLRERGDLAVAAGELSPEAALRVRPLDASLHIRLAERAAFAGDQAQALARSTVASELMPYSSDAWSLRSYAARELGDEREAASSLARMFASMQRPLERAFVTYLIARYPDAEELAALMPADLEPWTRVMESFAAAAPAYAAILAAARSQLDGREPAVLQLQVRLALAQSDLALALHYARLLRQLAPHEAQSHLLVARALEALGPNRESELQEGLSDAIERRLIADPAEVALLEEALVGSLVRAGQPEDLTRAREILPRLLARPGDRSALQRRYALQQALDQAGAASTSS